MSERFCSAIERTFYNIPKDKTSEVERIALLAEMGWHKGGMP
jgi:hypothetical protein